MSVLETTKTMNPIAQILWEAAADVERHGVLRDPEGVEETCAVYAIRDAYRGHLYERLPHWINIEEFVGWALGIEELPPWNDAQPSRAVVAAAMRDAAFLAEWAGPHLLEGFK